MRLRSLFLATILLSMFGHVAVANDYPFSIEALQLRNGHQIIAHNKGPAPITAVVSIVESQNIASNQRWPTISIVPPHSDLTIGVVYPKDPTVSSNFRTSAAFRLGVLEAQHDPNTLYRMPYLDGRTFTIGQAPSGPITTHNTPESQFAIDFTMPEGTLILATRSGIVVDIEENYTEGGKEARLLSKANSVRILHSDGTIATYAHLMPGGVGVSVKIGQGVKAGEIIGYSGSTGYSGGPHLHFSVSKIIENNGELSELSIPITFFVGKPIVAFEPRVGLRVTANYVSAIDPMRLDQSKMAMASAKTKPTLVGQFNSPQKNSDIEIQSLDSYADKFLKNREWLLGLLLILLLIYFLGLSVEKRRRQRLLNEIHRNSRNR